MQHPTEQNAPPNTDGHDQPVRRRLERAAIGFAAIVIAGSAWYWVAQVRSVLEILEMAYG